LNSQITGFELGHQGRSIARNPSIPIIQFSWQINRGILLKDAIRELPSMINHMPGNPPYKESRYPPFATSGSDDRKLTMGCRFECVKYFLPDSIEPLPQFDFFNVLHFPTDPFKITLINHQYMIDDPF
jgi:hypothetical protein